jgi:hypothetical protein
MIALRDNMPLLRFGDGQVVPVERKWLCVELAAAAGRAGYGKWWLASHVAASVLAYLESDYEEPTICVDRLQKAVRSVLQVIGYADVAEVFRVQSPPVRISLVELARAAGQGYELAFFDLLRVRLRGALDSRAERLEICDAQRGIKQLRSAKAWRRDCSGLLEEVVGFVREEVRSLSRPIEMQVS